jgi:DNA-binding response OmpR family regulator
MVVKKSALHLANRILVVGDEPTILASRAVQLAQWNPETTTSERAVSLLEKGDFELVVIGQSVPDQRATELITTLHRVQPSPKLLLIRLPESQTEFGVVTHIVRPALHPAWLLERVREMLVTSAESTLEPVH